MDQKRGAKLEKTRFFPVFPVKFDDEIQYIENKSNGAI